MITYYKYGNKRMIMSNTHIVGSPVALKLISPGSHWLWRNCLSRKGNDWQSLAPSGIRLDIYGASKSKATQTRHEGELLSERMQHLCPDTKKRPQWGIPSLSLSVCLFSTVFWLTPQGFISSWQHLSHTHTHTMFGTTVTQGPDR